jgi:CRP/FNR family cyclic AMP-dependent transcriptional regulator
MTVPTTSHVNPVGDQAGASGQGSAIGHGGIVASAFGGKCEDDDLNQPISVQRVQLFSGLGADEMTEITATARTLRKERGAFIYMPGDRADFVYVLRKGRIKLSVLSESGKEFAIDIIQPGEIFGEFALVDEVERSNMTRALDDAVVWVFQRRDFLRLLETRSKLAINYIRLVGDRRRRMEKKLSDITTKDVAARVCELLHELSIGAAAAASATRESLVPLTHQDNVFDTRDGYFANDPLGMWVAVWVVYTQKASTAEGREVLDAIAAANGRDLDGTAIITNPSQIDSLAADGLVELRTRPVDDPVFRWVICPIPQDPRGGYIRPDAFIRTVKNNGTPVFPALRNNFVCLQQTGNCCQ